MTWRILTTEPHITVSYNVVEDVLFADWTGDQARESVMDGCERILHLHYLKQHHCKMVLNDNSHVTSIWDDASEWVAVDWLPRMYKAGCRLFAWVYSPNQYSRLSADKALSYGAEGIMATTFDSKQTALAWLRAME
ncbi:hypothetical protein ACFSKU_03660 [Pontibacter silvestris]|uniref:STAS/SEC14 domain-containing protein n=1 Tax=Pontibacter silvestris TaxID=2305183 RepID=A0ABW4WVT5_9BACT|nr:hypothetical protein [Pontibacter silvestris]MCC9138042.1 hypothetical protein [Pontibacter silvestris]